MPTTTFCYQLTRLDGRVFAYTSLDMPITIDGITHLPNNSLNQSAVEKSTALRADNLDIQGILDDEAITRDDILTGKFDGARVDIFSVNYLQPTTKRYLLSGSIRELRLQGGSFVAEINTFAQKLEQVRGAVYSPACRVKKLGDALCRVRLAAHQHTLSVATILDARRFTHISPLADAYFQNGTLLWLTGSNTGVEAAIKNYTNGVIELLEDQLAAILAGHTFKATRGCNRTFAACRDIFNNTDNFQGEPPHLLPGSDALSQPLYTM
jgi:uncharacterized phage protein (TIGR02218 family)